MTTRAIVNLHIALAIAALCTCGGDAAAQLRRAWPAPVPVSKKSDSVRVAGGVLRFREAGHGSVVVLLSGGPGYAGKLLAPVFDHLSLAHRAVLIDQRGTGASTGFADSTTFTLANAVDDIEAVRRRLGVERIALLGHSWGGALAMAYVARYPTRVTALLLVGSAGLRPATTDAEISRRARARLSAADMDSIRALIALVPEPTHRDSALRAIRLLNWKAYEYDPASVRALAPLLTSGSFNERTARLMYADFVRTGPGVADDLDRALTTWRLPALIIHGEADPVGTVTITELQRHFPHGSFDVLPRSGHHPWIETPNLFYLLVDRFLDRVPN